MADTSLVFATVAGIICLGFLGEVLFKRTGLPSFLFLISVGILLGPVFQIFSGDQLRPILGLFAELTLVMILFYSGLDMKLRSLIDGGGRTMLLVLSYVALATIAIGLFGYLVMGWGFLQSFILGAIIGGQTNTPVVVPLAKSLKLPEPAVTLLTLESVMNSIVGIIVFLALIQVYTSGTSSLTSSLSGVAASFSIGIVPAAVMSGAWILLLARVKDQKYTYVLTLGLLLATYSITTTLGGSGELGVFVFGLMFGNYKILNSLRNGQLNMDPLIERLSGFQDEISFLLNTLFFVFLGLTFSLSPSSLVSNLAVASAVAALLLGSRVVTVYGSTARSELGKSRPEIILLSAQGVTQATLAIIALDVGIPLGNLFLSIVAYVIIITNVVTTVGSVWIRRKKSHGLETHPEPLPEVSAPSDADKARGLKGRR
jgi:cell volume regulation protein A